MANRQAIPLILAVSLAVEASLLAQQPVKTPRPEERAERIDRCGEALPKGAIARLGTVLVQGDLKIDRAAFGLSPDRKTIVTFKR